MGLIEHAELELKLAGYNTDKEIKKIETEQDYADRIGSSALELVKLFAKQGHSGFSAQAVLKIFNRLANYKPLTDGLSDNPEEWTDLSVQCGGEPTWQSKRNCSCFTHDMKCYYDIDDPDNNIYEKDDLGNLTGYAQLKPRDKRKMVELIHVS